MKKKTKNISIIGGGISGCVSAFLLSRKGYRVNLFERKNFLGGSIKDFTDEKNIFYNGPQYFDEKSFWFKELKKLNIFKNHFYSFKGYYREEKNYYNINKVYCDIFDENLINNNFPHPITNKKFIKLKNCKNNFNSLEKRINCYQENIQKPIKKWCKNFSDKLDDLNEDCASIISISRVFFQKDKKKIFKLKDKDRNADMLLGIPKIDFKGRYCVPKKGYDEFFYKLEKYLRKKIKIFLNSKIEVETNDPRNINLFNNSELIKSDKIIWACNPVPLIKKFGIDPIDNKVLRVKIFSSNITFTNKIYDRNFYIQVFSKKTNIFRIYFYKIKGKSKISVETFLKKDQNELNINILKNILKKFKINIKINSKFYEKKEIRHVLITNKDFKKFIEFEKIITRSKIISGGWHLFNRDKKIKHIISESNFYE